MKNTISKSPEILFFIAPDQVCSLPSSTFAHRRSQRRPNILCRHLDHKKKHFSDSQFLFHKYFKKGPLVGLLTIYLGGAAHDGELSLDCCHCVTSSSPARNIGQEQEKCTW